MDFVKGHGTENDFLVLPDDGVGIDLAPASVSALCDRRRGLGADGILRVARAGALVAGGVLPAGLPDGVGEQDWFMDYRNADGSVAEMCGNGVRVFAHYLRASGREDRESFVVGTRAGARAVTMTGAYDFSSEARVSVEMGPVSGFGESAVQLGGADRPRFPAVAVDVGNPHLVAVVDGLDAAGLAALDIAAAPEFDASLFPGGVNVEVVTPLRAGGVAMRVHERGVGETRSCGTGTVAAAYAALCADGRPAGRVEVTVPGGEVTVTIGTDGRATLEGPSMLVASGAVDDRWWKRAVDAAHPAGLGAAR
ncbi:diaminopimelate epimerase [Tomitella fengzijianii]|uniref:Diaminopimelate epimerase n=1 Tax=Tomitella fengzijianii TaxID=2597660 RepID=A0A516X3H9_9ACTN|nr:diaminopimelate epimerase [Tomitella fengzijianii]QDQ97632.1 diaminopimelate epimerase [Tomitella fengzijianii]